MSPNPLHQTDGPFRADQLKSGDPYELANGHPIECLPSGGRHARANLTGGLALATDPEVESAGVDVGYTPDPKNLRAPDIAVGNVPDRPGWVEGTPPLAVEYADTGQDEQALSSKITALLAAGTRYVWVVRMSGPREVEVHEPGKPRQVLRQGQQLQAPGVLRNPVPIEAMYDPAIAQRSALRNLLQRHGYEDLDAVRDEGRSEGLNEGRVEQGIAMVLRLLRRRFGDAFALHEQRIRALPLAQLEALAEALLDFADEADLGHWLDRNL